MSNKWRSGFVVVALLGVMAHSGLANAAGDATAGAGKVTACAACHGPEGKPTVDIYPQLAGKAAADIESALKAYRAGERTAGMAAMMTPQAANLSDQDIADIAAHYSQL